MGTRVFVERLARRIGRAGSSTVTNLWRRVDARMIAGLVVLSIGAMACSGAAPVGPASGAPTAAGSPNQNAGNGEGSEVQVGLTTSIAGLGDQGFNDLAAAGVQSAEEELGVDGQVVEAEAETDYVPNLQGFAEDDYELVYAVGFLMQDALREVAEANPDTDFAIIDAVVDLPNVASITFREEQGSFLAGVFAGLMTQAAEVDDIAKMEGTGKVGFIGGGDVPLIHKFEEGYVQGVHAVDPEIEVVIGYAGSFTDPAAGKELALSQYNSGVDMIYQAAGPTGTGVIEAAVELDRFVIGVDADQNPVAPDHVITSMLKNVDTAVYQTIESVVDGTFAGGQRVFGIDNGGVGLAPFHSLDAIVPQAVTDQLEDFTEQLRSGEIEIELSPAAGG